MSNELIYGIHAVSALLERQPERILEAWVLKGREDDRLLPLLNQLQRFGISIQRHRHCANKHPDYEDLLRHLALAKKAADDWRGLSRDPVHQTCVLPAHAP